jgi:hypothetical protein
MKPGRQHMTQGAAGENGGRCKPVTPVGMKPLIRGGLCVEPDAFLHCPFGFSAARKASDIAMGTGVQHMGRALNSGGLRLAVYSRNGGGVELA